MNFRAKSPLFIGHECIHATLILLLLCCKTKVETGVRISCALDQKKCAEMADLGPPNEVCEAIKDGTRDTKESSNFLIPKAKVLCHPVSVTYQYHDYPHPSPEMSNLATFCP